MQFRSAYQELANIPNTHVLVVFTVYPYSFADEFTFLDMYDVYFQVRVKLEHKQLYILRCGVALYHLVCFRRVQRLGFRPLLVPDRRLSGNPDNLRLLADHRSHCSGQVSSYRYVCVLLREHKQKYLQVNFFRYFHSESRSNTAVLSFVYTKKAF